MDGRVKKKWHVAADLAAVYGLHLGDVGSYEYVVGLWLNAPRQYSRGVLSTAHGVGVAFSPDPLTPDLFSGVAETPEQAWLMCFDANVRRAEAKAVANLAAGRPAWTK